ncbi:hypothetical protein ACWFN4_28680 [Bacillus mycoides]
MAQLQTLSIEEQETLLDNAQINKVAAKQMVQKMAQFVGTYDLNTRKGFKFEQGDFSVQTVILANNEDTIKVIYTKLDNEEKVSGSVIVEKEGKKVLKGYDIIEDEVIKTLETEIDEEFLAELKDLENRELPEADTEHEEVVSQLPCIYGNWCGPGCSGPSAPISKVDACCKVHDGCYGSRGYFACSCDKSLQTCLAPHIMAGSEWAITLSAWFFNQPCNPFK